MTRLTASGRLLNVAASGCTTARRASVSFEFDCVVPFIVARQTESADEVRPESETTGAIIREGMMALFAAMTTDD